MTRLMFLFLAFAGCECAPPAPRGPAGAVAVDLGVNQCDRMQIKRVDCVVCQAYSGVAVSCDWQSARSP